MKKYKAIVNGANFTKVIEGAEQKCGFFTTRYVEADSSDAAEQMALNLIREGLADAV